MTATEAILKSEKSDKRVLTIPDTMADLLIRMTEEVITENLIKQEELLPELEKKKAEYEAILHKKEEIASGVDDHKKLLEGLARMKSGTPGAKEIKVYHSLSNTTHKRHRTRDGNIPWTRTINDLLTKKGEFMTEDEIYAAILEQHPTWAFKNDLLKKKYFRYYFRDNIIKGKLKQFAYFNDKFGLSHWMENGSIKPKYLKQFMHN